MKKSLLTESEIRKFMKFAKLGSLTENFIDNNMEETVTEEGVVEETLEEEALEEEAVESPADFVQDLVDVIMQHLPGTDISVEKGEGEEVVDDMADMGDEEAPMGDMGDEEVPPEMPGDEMPALDDDEEEEEEPDMSGLVNEVTRRVAARLLKENKK